MITVPMTYFALVALLFCAVVISLFVAYHQFKKEPGWFKKLNKESQVPGKDVHNGIAALMMACIIAMLLFVYLRYWNDFLA